MLERSNNKIRSGLLVKQTPNNFYKQPRSSLSQHYEPGEDSNVHKRRVSLVGNDKSELLDEAK